MAKTENEVNPAATEKLTGTIKAYNLETLKLVEAPYSADFKAAENVIDAMNRLGNDEKLILGVLNGVLESKAMSEGKANAFADGRHVPKTSVLKYINQYRTSPLYSHLVTVERGKDGWKNSIPLKRKRF